jgi:MoaA/NifB/PqqE/SkfB family radical SAM enzyme
MVGRMNDSGCAMAMPRTDATMTRGPNAVGATSSRVIRGPRKAVAAALLAARGVHLALRAYRNPIRAGRAVHRLGRSMSEWATTTPGRRRPWTSHKCVLSSGRYFWDLYVPGFPSAAFDRCLEQELHRVEPIGRPAGVRMAVIAMTRRCALACEHCFEGDALNRPEGLSSAELAEIVRRVRLGGAAQIFFSGGEPLQRFDDLLTLTAAASSGADVWALTSGLGLTADRARRLREAGLTGVALSLDHWEQTAHDRFRRTTGAYDAVVRAALHARTAGLVVALSLCPTRSFVTAANLQRYAQTAGSLGAAFIQLFEPRTLGRYADKDVTLEPAQQRLLEAFCDGLNADDGASGLPGVRYLDWSARTFGCSGGDAYVYIDSAGVMHPCPFCRGPGVRVLDHEFDTALSSLKTAGCLSNASHWHTAARTTS